MTTTTKSAQQLQAGDEYLWRADGAHASRTVLGVKQHTPMGGALLEVRYTRSCPIHGTASASPYGKRQGPRDARILYLPSFEDARVVRDAHPGSRIVEYLRGYAIQLRVSGPYVTKEV